MTFNLTLRFSELGRFGRAGRRVPRRVTLSEKSLQTGQEYIRLRWRQVPVAQAVLASRLRGIW